MITVIVPTHNRPDAAARLLAHLVSTAPRMEIIVVDDGSSPPVTVEEGAARLIRVEPNRGQSAARNLGAREANGDILAFVDDDTLPASDVWDELTRLLTLDRHAWVAPRLTLDPDVDSASASGEPAGEAAEVEHLASTFLMTRKATFEAVGGFDESLRGAMDYELTSRARGRGHRLFAHPHVLAVHDDDRRAFRSDALRYHLWIEETPRIWAAVGGDALDSWMHGVYCSALFPRKRLLRILGRLLTPAWAWKLFLAFLPTELRAKRLARPLRSIICARAARLGLRGLPADKQRALVTVCRRRADDPPSWLIGRVRIPTRSDVAS